jgi:polar amino acid transport system substrate-binding protein
MQAVNRGIARLKPRAAFALLLCVLFMMLPSKAAFAQDDGPRMKVAVYLVPPYAGLDASGKVSGHSVRLWELVAQEIKRPFELVPVASVDKIVTGLQAGTFDLAIGALTVTPAREALVDFSNPTHPSGVAAAMRKPGGFEASMKALWASFGELLPLFALVGLLVTLAGFATWKLDQQVSRNSLAGRTTINSLGEGIYWAAVTMTTVGYGDKTPKSAVARLFTVLWIFIGVVVISIFSGTVTAKITTREMAVQAGVENALLARRIGAVRNSSAAEYLSMSGVAFSPYDTLEAALTALAEGREDAVFNSRGGLIHHIKTSHAETLEVLAGDLSRGWMAFALPHGAPGRELVNRALLKVLSSRAWAAERETMAREYGANGKSDRETF